MITVEFWLTIGQGHYEPDCPAVGEVVFVRTYPYKWIANIFRWCWDGREDYKTRWSKVV